MPISKSSPSSYLQTKGDLIGTDGTVPSALGVGANDTVLTADSAEDTGLKWAAAGGGQTLYDCVVASSGGDYTTVGAAVTAGMKSIFVRDGAYTESAITATSMVSLVGESRSAILNMDTDAAFSWSGGYMQSVTVNGDGTGQLNVSATDVLNCALSHDGTQDINIGDMQGSSVTMGNTTTSEAAVIVSDPYTVIDGNKFYATGAGGGSNGFIKITATRLVTFSNNYLEKLDDTVGGSTDALIVAGANQNITGNTFRWDSAAPAITVIGGQCVISSNQVWGNARSPEHGIRIQSHHNIVTGNQLYLCDIGMTFQNGGDDNTVVGNAIHAPVTSSIVIASGSNLNNIVGNYIDTIDISDSSIQSTILHNKGASIINEKEHIYMKNTSGGSLAIGDVVVLKAVAAGNEVTTTTTGGDDAVFGVCTSAPANDAWAYIQTRGKTTVMKVDGTTDIAVGDFIGTFTTAAIGMKAASGDMAFAIALEAYTTDDSAGVIDALLITPRKI